VLHSPQILLAPRKGIAAAGGGGFTLVAHSVSLGTPSSPVTTPGINTTGASLLVVAISQYNGVSIGSVSDSRSNTWTPLTGKTANSEPYSQLFYCASPLVGAGHTFTLDNGGGIFGVIGVQAWTGGVGTFDVQNGAINGTPGLSLQPGSVTPTVGSSLIVSAISADAGAASFAIDSGFTITDRVDYAGSVNEAFGMAYLVQGAAAAVNPSWSWSSSADAAATIASFKP
jgi:hypothetical protein